MRCYRDLLHFRIRYQPGLWMVRHKTLNVPVYASCSNWYSKYRGYPSYLFWILCPFVLWSEDRERHAFSTQTDTWYSILLEVFSPRMPTRFKDGTGQKQRTWPCSNWSRQHFNHPYYNSVCVWFISLPYDTKTDTLAQPTINRVLQPSYLLTGCQFALFYEEGKRTCSTWTRV